jgi:hypothetical protein
MADITEKTIVGALTINVPVTKEKKPRRHRAGTPKSLNAPRRKKTPPQPISADDDKKVVVKIGPGVTVDWS